jgi:hypothetical protein
MDFYKDDGSAFGTAEDHHTLAGLTRMIEEAARWLRLAQEAQEAGNLEVVAKCFDNAYPYVETSYNHLADVEQFLIPERYHR